MTPEVNTKCITVRQKKYPNQNIRYILQYYNGQLPTSKRHSRITGKIGRYSADRILSVQKFTANLYCICISILQIYMQYRFAVNFGTLSKYRVRVIRKLQNLFSINIRLR